MSKHAQKWLIPFLAVVFMAFSPMALASGAPKEEKKDGPIYVDFKSIVVPVIKKNGTTGVIALNMMAEVKDSSDQTKVTDHIPKLRDAFIRTLYGNLESKRFMKDDGALDIERIKTTLLKSAQYVMKSKDNPIKDILFQNIAQQAY